MRERWLVSIYKDIENFLQNMAIKDADPSLVVKWKSLGKWPLPGQMVFVLKPLTLGVKSLCLSRETKTSLFSRF